MVRFIIKRRYSLGEFGEHGSETTHETIDAECHDLENALRGGGLDGARFDLRSLVGVEILPAPEQTDGGQSHG